MSRTVNTACQLCIECCGVSLEVEDNKIIKIKGMPDHPINKGKLCPKGANALEWVNSPNRIMHPLKKVEGEFVQVSWDEALDGIAARLNKIKADYGPKAFSILMGMSVLEQGIATLELMGRFCDVYGTPNRFDVDSMCYRPRLIGYLTTLGKLSCPDTENSKCVVVWGNNPHNSMPPLSKRVENAVKSGAKLLVIDPRKTVSAQKADVHAQLRPGTDTAFALGLLNVIIAEKLYDQEFVKDWTVGFEQLAEHVIAYSPEKVEQITWVPAETIRQMARVFATSESACIVRGGNALDQSPGATHTSRAIAILEAITGNIDIPGGFVTPSSMRINSIRLPDRLKDKPLGFEKHPLYSEVFGRSFGDGQGMLLWDAILKGDPYPIKGMIVAGSNPALTFPDSAKVRSALEELELLVVMDYVISDTAKHADYILPAASFMERFDVLDIYRISAGLPFVMMRKKVVEYGECWSDLKFWLELSKRMGFSSEDFPWQTDVDVLNYVLQPSGLTVESLCNEYADGFTYGRTKYGEYKERGFRTNSGKVEIYSEPLASMGYDPLPTHIEPPESPLSTPELAEKYPLILSTGARKIQFLHSRLRDISNLRRSMPEALGEMHSDTAVQYGLADNDKVVVETLRGKIEIRLKVNDELLPGMIAIPHGWTEANANILTDQTPADPISGMPSLKAMLCRVEKSL